MARPALARPDPRQRARLVLPVLTYTGRSQGMPGRAVSSGGTRERAVGELLDRAHHAFSVAATRRDLFVLWRGQGLLESVGVLCGFDGADVDRLYVLRFDELPAETYRGVDG